MNRSQKRLGYLTAVVATTIVLVIRMAMNEALAEQARLMPFVIAVMAAAWVGGLWAGILATALSALAGIYFIVPPPFSLQIATTADAVNVVVFVFVGVTVSYLCEALHVARRAEADKRFRTLADSIAQLVWMARPDGYRFWFNERWYEYSGMAADEVEGDGWQSVCDSAELPRVLASWRAALAKGVPWEEIYTLRRRDGQMRWHLARAVPVRDEQGEITCWFGTSTDIHDRIASEQALKDADARKDQFLATLAHELRNPLAPISNALQLWPHCLDDKQEMEQLRRIMSRQVEQLVRLIDDLMDMARITRGKVTLRRAPLDLGVLIARAVETVRPLIDEAGHSLSVTLPVGPVAIDGDLSRLTQVLSNILSNAAKYTPPHGTISVVAEPHEQRVVIRVRDNGSGIPEHMLSSIFEPFRQIDTALSRSHGGLGIGLALARQFIELHGGTVEARSKGPSQGSEFVVTLPTLSVIPAGNDLEPPSPIDHPSGRRRIVVVDDHADSAETLARILCARGQDARAFNEGQVAIDWVLAHPPDVVFLDIAMPDLDGYEIARRLREHPELRSTVLVALTGLGQLRDQRQAFAAGFDYHLTKPATVIDLEGLLARLPAASAAVDEVTAA